jgi:hypothetical protein
MTRERLEQRFSTLRKLFILALAGIVALIASLLLDGTVRVLVQTAAFALIFPVVIYLTLFVIWHWKGRYIGEHSDLWGGLLLVETSGWMKLVYLFRHMLPDLRREGRYAARVE